MDGRKHKPAPTLMAVRAAMVDGEWMGVQRVAVNAGLSIEQAKAGLRRLCNAGVVMRRGAVIGTVIQQYRLVEGER